MNKIIKKLCLFSMLLIFLITNLTACLSSQDVKKAKYKIDESVDVIGGSNDYDSKKVNEQFKNRKYKEVTIQLKLLNNLFVTFIIHETYYTIKAICKEMPLMSFENYKKNNEVFKNFSFFVPSNNSTGSINTAISTVLNKPTLLAQLDIHSGDNSSIWLNATVGWQANQTLDGLAFIKFKIWRNAFDTVTDNNIVIPGTPIFTVLAGGEGGYEKYYLSSFSHVDNGLPKHSCKSSYYLTVEYENLPPSETATILGPITFTAAEIEC